MIYWALISLAIAVVAAIFAFGGMVYAAAGIAKFLFYIFLILFLVALIAAAVRRPAAPGPRA